MRDVCSEPLQFLSTAADGGGAQPRDVLALTAVLLPRAVGRDLRHPTAPVDPVRQRGAEHDAHHYGVLGIV